MKANELSCKDLMVGDWADVRNDAAPNTPHLERITPSHFLRDEHWYGVELVPEILEKNGFDKRWHDRSTCIIFDPRNDHAVSICYNYYNATISIEDMPFVKVNKQNERNQKIESIGCQYVHELQHALRLCGIEKEIEL